MTNQEVFNKVWKFFIVDKNPQAKQADGRCIYGEVGGKQCAIGCLLPLSRAIELEVISRERTSGGAAFSGLVKHADFAELFPELTEIDPAFADDIQKEHDKNSTDFRNEIIERLENLAPMYSLTIPQ